FLLASCVAILAQVDRLFEKRTQTAIGFSVEEDDVRGAPHRVRKKTAGLAGYDDFEDFRIRSELADKPLLGINGQRLHGGKMTEDCKNISFGGSQRRIEADTAKLQHGIRLVEVPGNIGAEGDRPLEALVDGRLC